VNYATVDYFTRFMWLMARTIIDSKITIKIVKRVIMPTFRLPNALSFNIGTHFTNVEVKGFYRDNNIQVIYAPRFHHKLHGLPERYVQIVVSILRKYALNNPQLRFTWGTCLSEI